MVNDGQWCSMMVNDGQWWSIMVNVVNGGQWWSKEVNDCQWWSINVDDCQACFRYWRIHANTDTIMVKWWLFCGRYRDFAANWYRTTLGYSPTNSSIVELSNRNGNVESWTNCAFYIMQSSLIHCVPSSVDVVFRFCFSLPLSRFRADCSLPLQSCISIQWFFAIQLRNTTSTCRFLGFDFVNPFHLGYTITTIESVLELRNSTWNTCDYAGLWVCGCFLA